MLVLNRKSYYTFKAFYACYDAKSNSVKRQETIRKLITERLLTCTNELPEVDEVSR